MEASPEKKIASGRKVKPAPVSKAKAADPGTATETKVVGSSTGKRKAIPSPTTPVIPPIGTQAYFEYMGEQRRVVKEKKRVARKKKLEQEETVFAKDIEDSEDEHRPKKLKSVEKFRIRNKQNEEAAAVARSRE